MDWAGATYGVEFLKKCWFFGRSIFQKDFFHDWGRRGRSRRENSGKITAAAFSRYDFLMVWDVGGRGLTAFQQPRFAVAGENSPR